jgi:hypothetical protein
VVCFICKRNFNIKRGRGQKGFHNAGLHLIETQRYSKPILQALLSPPEKP